MGVCGSSNYYRKKNNTNTSRTSNIPQNDCSTPPSLQDSISFNNKKRKLEEKEKNIDLKERKINYDQQRLKKEETQINETKKQLYEREQYLKNKEAEIIKKMKDLEKEKNTNKEIKTPNEPELFKKKNNKEETKDKTNHYTLNKKTEDKYFNSDEYKQKVIIEQFKKEELERSKGFYDLVLNFSNFNQLNNNTGWDIHWGHDKESKDKYKRCKGKRNVVIGIIGNKNRGKSFLLGRIIGKKNYIGKSGFLITTVGISANFPILDENDKINIITLDTAGKDNPLLEITDFPNKNIKDTLKIKEIARDQKVSEIVLSDYIIQESDVLITVLEQLSFAEQDMLKNLINQLKSKNVRNKTVNAKKLLVIHNLMNFTDINAINNFIESILMKSLTFDLRKGQQPMAIFPEKNNDDTKKYFYVQKTDKIDNLEIFHIVMGNDGDPKVRENYNEPAIRFIRNVIKTTTSKKFELIESFKNFITKNSQKYLNGGGFDEDSLVIDKKDEIEKSIKLNKKINIDLKGFFVDSKGINNFVAAIEPDYSSRICKDKKENKFYVEVTFELFGKIKKNNKKDNNKNEDNIITNISIQRNQHIITIQGEVEPENNENSISSINGNLKYSEFFIQLIIDKFYNNINSNDITGDYNLASIDNNKKVIEDTELGIYKLLFPIKFIQINKQK